MDPPGGPPVDVMIGSRYIPGGGIEGWPWRRHLMSRGVNLYARWLLGLKSQGLQRRLPLLPHVAAWPGSISTAVRSRGYSFQEEILWRLERLGARFGETPIVFVDRRGGCSKINTREAIAALWIILGLGLRNLLKW